MTIKIENSRLIHDRPVEAHRLDDHMMHIALHHKIFEDPIYKDDPFIRERVLKHINEHTMYIKSLIEY